MFKINPIIVFSSFLLIFAQSNALGNYKQLEERVKKLEDRLEKIKTCECSEKMMQEMMSKEKMPMEKDHMMMKEKK